MLIPSQPNISFLIPAKNASSFLENTLINVHQFLEQNFKNQYEIILILNGNNESEIELMRDVADRISKNFLNLKICFTDLKGKGSALRAGYEIASGKNIFFTDSDLPYDLSFFIEAYSLLQNGYHLISGNRRFSDSRFTLPVSVLPLAYGRHRVGINFNRVVRYLLRIRSIDTQAGIKAYSREIGDKIYSLKTCPGFLFDIEFFLVAQKNGFKKRELPVHLFLNTEKTTVKLIKESYETLIWLNRIFFQNLRGYYRFHSEMNFKDNYFITADDWGLSPSVNRGILALVKKGVITRVSILADGLFCNEYLDELKDIKKIEFGIHFNLTHENLFTSPLNLLFNMLMPWKKKKIETHIKNELERQFEIIKNLGIEISYADGHHHCHIFPGVSRLFVSFLIKKNIRQSRLPSCLNFLFSSKILLLIFSFKAKREFKKNGITSRPFFYPNYSKIKSGQELRKKLVHKLGYEIITHPSDLADLKVLSINDSYNHERVKEYHLLDNLVMESFETV